jgi:hypothetical protein
VAVFLLTAMCIVAVVGCAGTGGGSDAPASTRLILKEIEEIDGDIVNAEEMYKANLTALQMNEDSDTRREVNRIWVDLERLRARKAALKERLAEIEAEKKE